MSLGFQIGLPGRGERLRRRGPILAAILLALAAAAAPAATSLHSDRWLADVKYLASDALKGRGAGMAELNHAAKYIQEQFKKAGLEPVRGSYFQPFEAVVGAELGANNHLTLLSARPRSYKLKQDFIPLGFSGTGDKSAGVAFAGYGISASEYNYDDYRGVDVQGKVVILLRHEPQEDDEKSVFRGKQFTRHAGIVSKAINARNHGAAAVLLINDPLHHSDDKLIPFGSLGGPNDFGIPLAQVKQSVAAEWFKQAGRRMEDLQRAIDGDLSNHSFLFPPGVELRIQADVRQRRSTLKNVVGYLPGSDPALRDQIIVIGAHYDHLGLGEQSSMAPDRIGQIHHGADDNASGTAGMMELARLFSAERSRLRHSFLFMAYAGEELGLLGSAHYVQQPLLPLERTIAMLNLDMIGRVNKNKLYIGGVGTSPQFRQLVEEENKDIGFQLDFSDSGYDASDHMSFARHDVPVMFFFSGLHSDYHKPSDTWEKMEPVETTKVLDLVSRLALRMDAASERPQYVRVERRDRRSRGNSEPPEEPGQGYGAYFGSIPDFGETERGVKFADVRAGSPAAQAGLRAGDILIQFDGKEIASLYDFTYALQEKQVGDEVPVVVLRGGQEVKATVKLGRRE